MALRVTVAGEGHKVSALACDPLFYLAPLLKDHLISPHFVQQRALIYSERGSVVSKFTTKKSGTQPRRIKFCLGGRMLSESVYCWRFLYDHQKIIFFLLVKSLDWALMFSI